MTNLVVRVPATSANLGPGFDTFGLALSFFDEIKVTVKEESGLEILVHGEGSVSSKSPVSTDESNLVIRSILYAYNFAGLPPDGLMLTAKNLIPHGRGLGSSSSAIVSGLLIAKGLLKNVFEFDDLTMLKLASEIEGHSDNVAPALFGGLTLSWSDDNGPNFERLKVHETIKTVILVPSFEVSTSFARSLQPQKVSLSDAVFNLAHSSLLILALTQKPDLLFEATRDRLHQDYRAEAMPETQEFVRALRNNGFPAVVSGAGPSILVFVNGEGMLQKLSSELSTFMKSGWKVMPLEVSDVGGQIFYSD